MDKSEEAESNTRIIGILSVVFSFIPVVGIVLGIIATQKGRKGKSSFAVTMGWIGIGLSILITAGGVYWRYQVFKDDEVQTKYQNCIQGRLNEPYSSTGGIYSVAEAQCDWAKP